jgi:type VI secretion system protein ImpD
MESLLGAILEATATARAREALAAPGLDRFLAEPDPWRALAVWLDLRGAPTPDASAIARRLVRDIARLDELLGAQVNAILHHPAFQRLEASWRGLAYLVTQMPPGANVKVRVLGVSWRELARDAERALEFDQSVLFRKVYDDEFGHPGGEPFGVLLGDYEVRGGPSPGHPTDDVATLGSIGSVAAAAFAPFLVSAHPALLGLESFAELERSRDLTTGPEGPEGLKWRTFRRMEDSRFVGLTLPRVLWRTPYDDDGGRADGFRFREEAGGPDDRGLLWGSAVYAFGAVLGRAFADSGWFADIRGAQPGVEAGGLVVGLPEPCFATDATGLVPKGALEVVVTDAQEKQLGELGLIPLCQGQGTPRSAFYGNQSVQKPERYDDPAANANARLSTMLQYMLCVARFAHYLKVQARDRVGTFAGPADCEDFLHEWLMEYTLGNDDAPPDLKARHPLREARVQVRERPDRPGRYVCVTHLRPHFQLDQMAMAIRLATELAPATPG